jgi:hypothetical protein
VVAASENTQINLSTLRRIAQCDVAVQTSLLSCRKAGKARICASAKYPFTHEMKNSSGWSNLDTLWYPNECCADKDCHPVPCDEISEGENGAMHWKNLIFEGSQIRTSPDGECHVCHLLPRGSTGYSHLYLHSEEAVSVTLAPISLAIRSQRTAKVVLQIALRLQPVTHCSQ